MPPSERQGTRIAHVGIAIADIQKLLPILRDVLQMDEVPIANSDGAKIAALEAGNSLVELLEPDSPDSPIGRYLSRRGPGIHHICLFVDDLDDMLLRCQNAGMRLVDTTPRIGAEGKRIAFIHPESTAGILIELSEG